MMGINSTRKQKVHSLTGRITLPLLLDSFKSVKRNRGAAGIDKVSLKMFEANLLDNLRALLRDLKNGSFEPFPLRRAYVPKNETELRPLGIPAVRHHHGLRVVLDADIQAFFDNLPQPVIMQAVAAEVADGNILRLVQKFLRSGVMEHGVFKPTSIGTPQGGVISPLLANIVLNHLDWQLHARGFNFVRYADDFVVICQSKTQAEGALHFVRQVLATLGLQLSAEKTRISTFGKGYSFLGFVLAAHTRRMRPKSLQKFKDKIRALSVRHYNFESETIVRLNRVIRGTALYFGASFATCRWQFQKLDSWIRMRLRCMKLKRKLASDNYKLRNRTFTKLGLLSLEQFCLPRAANA
ncbi:MAG: group II intron reverse transcriptase/maturase [Acidobacteria bacterium]|nr:group II intron reverse transcriptase/maturase [Acidobacteriota bacterium]